MAAGAETGGTAAEAETAVTPQASSPTCRCKYCRVRPPVDRRLGRLLQVATKGGSSLSAPPAVVGPVEQQVPPAEEATMEGEGGAESKVATTERADPQGS